MIAMGKPKIRFKGYEDDWEQRKLGDNIIEYHEVTTENNQYPVLTSSRKGIFLQTEYYSGNQVASSDNTGYNVVPYGYFTYRHMSDDQIFYFNINDIVENGIVSTLYPVFTTNIKLDSRYLQYQLNYGREFAKFAILQKQGGSRTYMYLNKLKSLCLTMPKTIGEQKKISEYFMKLDHLITLHQRKCEETKSLKKYMLQKMFPENGKCVPEIRFSGFSDDWEQRKLSEFVDKAVDNRGKTPPIDDNGTHPLIEVAALGGVHPDYSKVEKYLNDDSFKNNLRAYVKEGDILFTTVGSIGLVSLMDSMEEAAIAQNIVAFRAKENFVPEYLYSLFSNEENQYKAKRIVMGAVQPSIKVSQLVDVEYMLTQNVKEQQKIGEYFSNLDHLITLHQHKCDELQKLKKFMLQNMFM